MRSSRRRDLTRLLREGRASSQRDIVDELRSAGHEVTQATISRDLQELGALKVRTDGGFVYRLPDEMPRGGGDLMTRNLLGTLEEFAVDVRQASNLVVVMTAPGHAAAVGRAIDLAPNDDVIGTVAGDDTIFVATPNTSAAARLAAAWTHTTSAEVGPGHDN
jgi:transcriptional regulator of arginine metabolism